MRFLKPLVWTAAILALLVVGYATAGYWLAPGLIKSKLPSAVAEATGQRLTLGEVVVKPFALSVDVRDVALVEPDGSALLGVGHLFIDLELASIWQRAAVFKAIILDDPTANLVLRPDGSLNLLSALEPKTPPPEPKPPEDAELFRLSIGEIAINRGVVDAADLRSSKPIRERFAPINVSLKNLSTTAGGSGTFALSGRGVQDSLLALNGKFKIRPFSLRGGFAIRGLQVSRAWQLGGEYDRIAQPSGVIELQTDYSIASTPEGVVVGLAALGVNVRDLAVRGPGADSDWVKIAALTVAGASVDLTGSVATVPEISITGLDVHAWRGADNAINLAALAPPPAESVWRIAAPKIRVTESRIEFADRAAPQPVTIALAPFELDVDGYASDAEAITVALRSGFNQEGQLVFGGTWHPPQSAGEFSVKATKLPMVFVQPYLEQTTDLILKSGQLTTEGKLSIAVPEGSDAKIGFDGTLRLAGFRSVDRPLREDFVRFGSLELTGISYRSQPASVRIREVLARDAYFKLVLAPDGTTNIAAVLSPPRLAKEKYEPAAAVPEDAKSPPLNARIDRVRFVDSSANFADLSLRPPFATGIQDLEGSITGLSSDPDARAELSLDGKVDDYAPVEIRGQVNYLAATSYTDIKAQFSNIELPSFTPYSGKFMGYKIAKGKLSATFNYKVEDRKLDAQHKFVLDQLTLGEKVDSPDAVKLPVKLAIALLKDKNGVIDIDLPISGTIDDPQFRVGPIIWKVLINLLVKIVTAPFALIGALFGADEDVRFVEFPYGSAALARASSEQLGKIGGALVERPQLNLDVPLVVDPKRDREALVETRYSEMLTTAAKGTAPQDPAAIKALRESDPDKYQKIIDAAWRETTGEEGPPRPERAKDEDKDVWKQRTLEETEAALQSRVAISDSEVEGLAKLRADAVRDAVIGPTGIDPARVFLTKGAPAEGPSSGVRLELKLE